MSGSFACQDLKSLRLHFSPLLPSCPHHSSFKAASCLPWGEGPLPLIVHPAVEGGGPRLCRSATFHKPFWIPPQVPEHGINHSSKPCALVAGGLSACPALTVRHGGYCRLHYWRAASVRRPDGIAAITM